MLIKENKTIKTILIWMLLIMISIFIINYAASSILKNKIQNVNSEYSIKVKNIHLNLLNGYAEVKELTLNSKKRNKDSIALKIQSVNIMGISITNLISPKSLSFKKIKISSPEINVYKGDTVNSTDNTDNPKTTNLDYLKISDIQMVNGKLTYHKTKEDSIIELKKINLSIVNFKIDSNTIKKHIPFTYKTALLMVDSLSVPMSKYEKLQLANLTINNDKILINNLQIIPYYSKQELQSKINIERDWIKLFVKRLEINDYIINKNSNDSLYSFKKFQIDSASLVVYRNKLLADDSSYKPLYSKQLRELPIKLNVDSIFITKSSIIYEERVEKEGEPGKIHFNSISSTITNINNYKKETITNIDLTTMFMNDAKFDFKWSFQISNTSDYFNMNGKLVGLDIAKTNEFLLPNLNVKTSGYIKELNFNIAGNDVEANGTLNMNYEDFKIDISKKDKTIKSVLNAVANLIIKNKNRKSKNKEFKVTRDQQKSVFNYLWLCIKDGALDNII